MKILLVHNFYGSAAPSGENQVFEAEKALLQKHGHDVLQLTRHSDDLVRAGAIGKVKGALATPWNPWMAVKMRDTLRRFTPDVVHVHNTFPLISNSVFQAIGNRAARVITLHNYRLFCAAAIPMREGKVCTECLDLRSSIPAVMHGCYRGSRIATLPLAASVGVHRQLGTWTNQVEAFIALSGFQRELMSKAGLPREKVHVKPNFYTGNPNVIPWRERDSYIVFAGRLTVEKGVETLLSAWRAWGEGAPELRLVGDGDLRSKLERMAAGLNVHFLGQLDKLTAQAQIAGAKMLVLPSECFEGFPLVISEAFASGTPVAVSDIGPLSSIVAHGVNGIVFPAGNSSSMLNAVRGIWGEPSVISKMAIAARKEFEDNYTEDTNYQLLMEVYESAVAATND